jgi:hypothetical protein
VNCIGLLPVVELTTSPHRVQDVFSSNAAFTLKFLFLKLSTKGKRKRRGTSNKLRQVIKYLQS